MMLFNGSFSLERSDDVKETDSVLFLRNASGVWPFFLSFSLNLLRIDLKPVLIRRIVRTPPCITLLLAVRPGGPLLLAVRFMVEVLCVSYFEVRVGERKRHNFSSFCEAKREASFLGEAGSEGEILLMGGVTVDIYALLYCLIGIVLSVLKVRSIEGHWA